MAGRKGTIIAMANLTREAKSNKADCRLLDGRKHKEIQQNPCSATILTRDDVWLLASIGGNTEGRKPDSTSVSDK
jgi:hypothetical protein